MAIIKTQVYRSSLALLLWLHKFEKIASTKYDIDFSEMDYLATNLSPQECYDFYRLLSHRKTDHGVSIYVDKEKAGGIPCISLLVTWLTDPDEVSFRNHENIELKLREIGRKDLARWILGKIDSSLRRRQLDDAVAADDYYRQIEESEYVYDGKLWQICDNDYVITRKKIGGQIIPSVSLSNRQIGMKNEDTPKDFRSASCVFWKIFFSVVIVIFLVFLFLCFYRFLYTKLRCICRRFVKSEDQECCLPEQTYGTTSCVNSVPKNTSRRCNFFKLPDYEKMQNGIKDMESDDNFSFANETNDDTVSNLDEEKRHLLFGLSSRLKNRSSSIEKHFYPDRQHDETSTAENFNDTSNFKKSSSSTLEIAKKMNAIKTERNGFDTLSEKNLPRRKNSGKIRKNVFHSQSVAELEIGGSASSPSHPSKKSRDEKKLYTIDEKMKSESATMKSEKFDYFVTPKWTSCDCNLIVEKSNKFFPNSPIVFSSRSDKKSQDFFSDRSSISHAEVSRGNCSESQDDGITKNSHGIESITELSETYDELGMLFSQQMKIQSKPCRRKYCPLMRNLRSQRGKMAEHDERKCRTISRANFSVKAVRADQRPACSTGNICPETYDEFELMRASREQREILTRSIIARRKKFLVQSCVSPMATQRFGESANPIDIN